MNRASNAETMLAHTLSLAADLAAAGEGIALLQDKIRTNFEENAEAGAVNVQLLKDLIRQCVPDYMPDGSRVTEMKRAALDQLLNLCLGRNPKPEVVELPA